VSEGEPDFHQQERFSLIVEISVIGFHNPYEGEIILRFRENSTSSTPQQVELG
jgi:hypothetical protein